MTNEIRAQVSLQIKAGNLNYQSRPTAFTADLNTVDPAGPTPGSVLISVWGTDVNLSQLTTYGGMCWLTNTDPTNYVTWGKYIASIGKFVPFGEILPGECFLIRLSRRFNEEQTGTGTYLGSSDTLHFVASGAPVRVRVEAFDP